MMKKQLLIVLLALCMLLSACGGKAPEATAAETAPTNAGGISAYDPNSDAQNKYLNFAFSFYETDDYFCGSGAGRYLYYYDKTTEFWDYLCSDPTCNHNSTVCPAYCPVAGYMSIYNGQRYWVTNGASNNNEDDTLWRSDLGGTNRQQVKIIDYDTILSTYVPQQYIIHRGYLYVVGYVNTFNAALKPDVRISLLRSPLDDSQEFEVLFDETYSFAGIRSTVRFLGDDVYFGVHSWTNDSPMTFNDEIYRIDTQTGEKETVYEEMEMSDAVGAFWVTDDATIYVPGVDAFWKIENGQRIEVAAVNGGSTAAGIYDGVVVSTYLSGEPEQRCVQILDLSGEEIYNGPMFPEGIAEMDADPNNIMAVGMGIIGGDRDKLIVYLNSYTDDGSINYFYALDLQNQLSPTMLWCATQ